MKSSKLFFFLFIVSLLTISLISCEKDDHVVLAKVNHLKIYEEDVEQTMKRFSNNSKSEVLEKMILEAVFYLEAVELGFDKEERFKNLFQDYGKSLKYTLLFQREIEPNVNVTEEDVQKAFKERTWRFNNREYDQVKQYIRNKLIREEQEKMLIDYAEKCREKHEIEINQEYLKEDFWNKNKDNDIIIGTIDSESKIYSNELASEIRYQKGIDRYFKDTLEVRKELFQKIINKRVFYLEAQKKISDNDKEYQHELEKFKKRELFKYMLFEYVPTQIEITDAQALEVYNSNREKYFKPERIQARHILLDKKETADRIIKDIRKSKDPQAAFMKFAKEYARGPESLKDLAGDLGTIQRGIMPSEFDEVAFKMSPDQISDPVKTKYGYHIILVEKKESEQYIPFEKVKNKIKYDIFSKNRTKIMNDYFESVKSKYKIKTYLKEESTNGKEEKDQE